MTREEITHERVTQLLLDVMEFTYNSGPVSEAEKKVLDDIRTVLAEPEKPRIEGYNTNREPVTFTITEDK
jgi:hypothetical protein